MNAKSLFDALDAHQKPAQEACWITLDYLQTHLLNTAMRPPRQGSGRGIQLDPATLAHMLAFDNNLAEALLTGEELMALQNLLSAAQRKLLQLTSPPPSDHRLEDAVRSWASVPGEEVRF